MDRYRRVLLLLVLLGLFCISGAQCPRIFRRWTTPEPRVLPPSATLEQVRGVVNRNSSKIHSFSTNHATLSVPGLPRLRVNLAFQRPRRFRLRAELLNSPELDVGSNDRLFWFWVKRNQPPAVYYCHHEQFAGSPLRQVIPIDPDWLIEALGLVEFDQALPIQNPVTLPGNRLEVRTIRETPEGAASKSIIIDAVRGWVLEQHVYDARGQLIASAVASRHRRDPATGVIMPGRVDINCPRAELSMRIDLGDVEINRLLGNPQELWTMPSYQGSPMVDVCDPSRPFSPPPAPTAVSIRPRPPQWR